MPLKRNDAPVVWEGCELVRLSPTGKAWLVKLKDVTEFIPIGQIKSIGCKGQPCEGMTVTLTVSKFIADRKFGGPLAEPKKQYTPRN